MIQTVVDMYKYFLLGVKKEQTTIVPPMTFNMLINEEQDKWYKEKVTAIEINQKRIDDLQIFRTATDGIYSLNGTIIKPIGPDEYQGYVFTLPYSPDININNVWVSGTIPSVTTQHYPKYRRLLNVMFKLGYVNNECDLTGISEWLEAKIMYSDRMISIIKNPYRKPTDMRLYYEIINNKIRLITGTESYGVAMRLEYLRYARDIYFSTDTSVLPHVDCELMPEQQQEIVDKAVLTYIERSKNPRYQTAGLESRKEQMFK